MINTTIILGGIALRLIPHLPNFSSISATALFAGTRLPRRYAFILPLIIAIVSDYLLLYVNPFSTPILDLSGIKPISAMFHATTLYVWSSFLVSGLIGLWLRRHFKASNLVLASLITSLQFFLITNFGVWAAGAYSRGIDGLITSYAMGLPFLRWTMLGDLFYSSVFFSIHAFATRVSTKVSPATLKARVQN